jgi:hypothetical protein
MSDNYWGNCFTCHQPLMLGPIHNWDWRPDAFFCDPCGWIEDHRLAMLDNDCVTEYVNTELYSHRAINELPHTCSGCDEIIPNRHHAFIYTDGIKDPKYHLAFHKYCESRV